MKPPRNRPRRPAARRVQLPSGKTIEVVYFGDAGRESPAPVPTEEPLETCAACGSGLVQPVSWEEADGDRWALTLQCPECWQERNGVFGPDAVERLDGALDHGLQVLVRDLKQLMRANMEEELDRFAAALAADQIWPMDF